MKNYILLLVLSFGTLGANAQVVPHKEVNSKIHFSDSFKNSTLVLLKHAQDYDTYVKVKSIYDIVEVVNFKGQLDTLVLYFADTKFYSDNWKRKRYLRACFLSRPYQFYQVEVGNKNSGYTVGSIDQENKTIEILRNDENLTFLSELCYTIME